MNVDLEALQAGATVPPAATNGLRVREVFTTDERGIRQVDVVLERVAGAEHIDRAVTESYQRGELVQAGVRKSPWRFKRPRLGETKWKLLHDPPPISEAARFYLGVD